MNVLLGGLVIFATFVTLCNASCYLILNDIVPEESTKECTDLEGNKHPINSRWRTDNCETCACGEKEISCCTLIFHCRLGFSWVWCGKGPGCSLQGRGKNLNNGLT
uniref:Beta-microseminoprotein n=1 Tax=Callithrix jacchus TaxID=9483 RepID=A0A8I3WSA9_CALJA